MGKAGRARFYPLYEAAAEDFRKRLTESIDDLIDVLKASGLPDHPQRRRAAAAADFETFTGDEVA